MNLSDGYERIGALEMGIARYVLIGEIEWARELAISLAQTRDSMLTHHELLAASRARRA